MIVVTILFLALIIGLQPVKFKIGRPGFFKRCLPGVVLGAVLVMFAGTLQQENFQNEHRLYNKLFTPVFMTQVDGIPVTFVMNLAYMSIEKPQKYSVGEAKEFLKKYEEPQETEESIDTILEEEGKDASDDTSQSGADTGMPNIIVVMNESFSDLSVLGDFKTNEDYLPFLHSLQQGAENTVTGMLNVSVCGGNTADTEYEFLTGNTMAFLPQGSIPYQQYVNGERPSLASYLQSLGYETVATHPYYATGWNRDKVYPWLGFEQSIFKDQYYGARFVRDYVSDASCADKIIQLYEQKEEGRPLFMRLPDSAFTFQNFARTQLYSAMATLKIGMDILIEKEHAEVDSLLGHGGFFKAKGVGQKLMAGALHTPVSVMETAGEGGPWGMALLASYLVNAEDGETLEDYLDKNIFAEAKSETAEPDETDMQGFDKFLERYKATLPVEKSAVETLK